MESVNKTLYIPLYGKAYVSKLGLMLHDPWAEKIWEAEGFPLKGKSRSKWLAYYMGMRSAVFDEWVTSRAAACPEAVILHLGCGLDSRARRTGLENRQWYDVDFPEVMEQRRRWFPENGAYHLVGADIRMDGWLPGGKNAIVIMEGVSMYLRREELTGLMKRLRDRYDRIWLLMDCYTEFAARASRYKNPINDVGVTRVFGVDDPDALAKETGSRLLGERDMTPVHLIGQLGAVERQVFRRLYAGAIARRMYRLYEFSEE